MYNVQANSQLNVLLPDRYRRRLEAIMGDAKRRRAEVLKRKREEEDDEKEAK